MIASPLPRPPRKSPSSAISSARTTIPSDRASPLPAAHRLPAPGHQGQATPRRARRTGPPTGRRRGPARTVSVAVGSRSSRTWVATMPSSARQRATSRPTRRSGASSRPRRNRSRCGPTRSEADPARPPEAPHGLALLLGRGAAARPGSRPSAPAAPGRSRPGSVRRAGRRCGRCRPRRWRPGRRPGICTIESRESMPSRCFSGTGTPITGQRRDRGEHAGQVGGATGSGDDHLEPAAGRLPAVGEHLARASGARRRRRPRARCRTRRARSRRLLHHRPVGVGPHHDAHAGAGRLMAHSLSSPRSPRNHAAACRARSRQSSRSSP